MGASHRARRFPAATTGAVIVWALLMLPLLFWGLPGSANDDLLFGDSPPWPAERYDIQAALEQRRQRPGGADTDLDPVADPDRIVDLTTDQPARAQIIQRYRLYSRQPDEVIIFQALQRMNPRHGDFDPRLYQYGGGYIYLVGASLGASSLLGLIHVTPDGAHYLEQPAAFARFYVVARLISLVFGALALVAVHKLARRTAGRTAGWIAMLAVALSPVFITAVCEAKPHLPSACMILWAVLSALDYQARGRLSDAIRLGLQGGYAFALVLTGGVVVLLWAALLVLRTRERRVGTIRHLLIAAALALLVYLILNPFLVHNALRGDAAFGSNISNSIAMYEGQARRSLQGAVRVVELLLLSCGPGVLLLGLVGFVVLVRQYRRETLVAALPGLGILLLCILLGAGKPAEFARFLVLPVMLLCVAAGALLASLARRRATTAVIVTFILLFLIPAPAYVRAFAVDARVAHESRRQAGLYLARSADPNDVVGVLQEPAPYAVPPMDFTTRRVLLLPPSRPRHPSVAELPEWLVFTADDDQAHARGWWQAFYRLEARFPAGDRAPSPIAWANKPVFVYRRAP